MASPFARVLPFLDLRGWRASTLPGDLGAAAAVTVLSIPQGVAYALIAGLPPVVGLYAAMVPAAVGSFFRSSRHVIAGPTNALSLLVGGAVAAVAVETGASPVALALTLALLVGVVQVAAGLLRLGAVVDYISSPVVLGYVSGAAVLIAAGQLSNLTGTPMAGANLFLRLESWAAGLGATDPLTLGVGLGTLALVLVLRRADRRIPGAVVAMAAGIGASLLFDLRGRGVRVVADLTPVPGRLPPLTLPELDHVGALLPAALAATVLSLVESSSVGRGIAARTGDRLDMSAEFTGQGLANVAAAFFGGYPISGSLSRSVLCWRAGGQTRLAGVYAGILVLLAVWLAGPVVDHTPVASLAGLLMVLAWDLVDRERIRVVFRSGPGDIAAFTVTLVSAWLFELDQAIYLGVLISVVLFLRRARLLTAAELAVDEGGRLREVRTESSVDDDDLLPPSANYARCGAIRILHIEGSLFFGAASELQQILDGATADPHVRVLVLRLKRCQGLDVTTAEVLRTTADQLRAGGRHLILVGMRPGVMERMEALGLPDAVGREQVYPTRPGWFEAMDRALLRALHLAGDHHDDGGPCPLRTYLAGRRPPEEAGGAPRVA